MPVFWILILIGVVLVAAGAAYNINREHRRRRSLGERRDRSPTAPRGSPRRWRGSTSPHGPAGCPRWPATCAPAPSRPTYRELATAGTGLVAALADEGRWDEAAEEARDLKRLFGGTPDELGPIVMDAFDGLLAAAVARDRDELQDFVELVEALFP